MSGTGSISGLFGSELVHKKIDSGVQFIAGSTSSRRETLWVSMRESQFSVTVAITLRVMTTQTAQSVCRTKTHWQGRRATHAHCARCQRTSARVTRQTCPAWARCVGSEFPMFLGALSVFINVLGGKPIGVKRVAEEEVQMILGRARVLLAIFEIEEIKATLCKLQSCFHRNPGSGWSNPFWPCGTQSTCHMSQPDARLSQWSEMTHSGDTRVQSAQLTTAWHFQTQRC